MMDYTKIEEFLNHNNAQTELRQYVNINEKNDEDENNAYGVIINLLYDMYISSPEQMPFCMINKEICTENVWEKVTPIDEKFIINSGLFAKSTHEII